MPNDTTTIYWDGYGSTPDIIDTLPAVQREFVLSEIHKLKDELSYSDPTPTYAFFIIFIILFSVAAIIGKKKRPGQLSQQVSDDYVTYQPSTTLTYYGDTLDFPDETIIAILQKRLPYYSKLNETDKAKFLYRLKKFIRMKTFIIHDTSGFREMPVLISASAIQLSFGLKKYLLPHYDYIQIYPQEFINTSPSLRYLIGYVYGNSINISWKHFLEGFQYPEDGSNVGLHEMAHAYYFQNMETGKHIDDDFANCFPGFSTSGSLAFEREKAPGNDFYSDYALKDFQEFWAESVELFFEKPQLFKATYPGLYETMVTILNQDPVMMLYV